MIDTSTNLAPSTAFEAPQGPKDAKPDAGKQIELLFTRMMIKEMRKAMPEDGPFGGREMSMYMDLLDDSLAERIAESGSMGIAEKMNQTLNAQDGNHLRSDTTSLAIVPSHNSTHLSQSGTHDHKHASHLPVADNRPVNGKVTSTFGKRVDPITGKARLHKGLDIAAVKGTDIESVRGGTVTFAGERGGYGQVVYVDHGDGLETRYAHCSRLLVKTGDTIAQGQVLAEVGSTGRSTGNHLHFEARKDGVAIDPKTIFNCQNWVRIGTS